MTRTRKTVLALLALLLAPLSASAETRFALIISGASGGEKYAEQMNTWRGDLRTALINRYQFKPEFVKIFVDEAAPAGEKGTAENVRKFFAELRKTSTKDDFVLIVLLGHGTFDGDVAKFNLVGPDMTAKDWTDALNGVCRTEKGRGTRAMLEQAAEAKGYLRLLLPVGNGILLLLRR